MRSPLLPLVVSFLLVQVAGVSFSSANEEGGEKWQPLLELLFDPSQSYRTDALVIANGEEVLFERYANGFRADQPHRVWSVTKSITGALVGVAEKQGLLSVSDKVRQYYPLAEKYRERLTIRDLLQMSSGLRWNEGYELTPFNSDVIRMLYTANFTDMAGYTASLGWEAAPGEKFRYSSGTTNLLMGILKKVVDEKEHADWPWTQLFDRLGMKDVTFESDASGTFVGSSYGFMTARDLARLGQLYLNQGRWKGEEILAADYVRDSLKLAPSLKRGARFLGYGYHWWLAKRSENPEDSEDRGFPEDVYMASGHHGQIMAVFPSQKMILVRLATDKGGRLSRREMLQRFYQIIQESEAL